MGKMISKVNEASKLIKKTINHRIKIHIESNINQN